MPRLSVQSRAAAVRTAAPRERIVTGARRHFLAHGFRSVTMDDLAAELRMSKKTLYEHFPGKAVLLEAVVAAKFDQVERELAAIADDASRDLPDRLRALLTCLRGHTEEVQPSFVRDVAREAPELFLRVRERRRAVIQRFFGGLLREGRAAGMIRKNVPERLLIEALIGMTDAIVNPQMLEELALTPKAAFSEIITLFLEGAKTEKGRRKL